MLILVDELITFSSMFSVKESDFLYLTRYCSGQTIYIISSFGDFDLFTSILCLIELSLQYTQTICL